MCVGGVRVCGGEGGVQGGGGRMCVGERRMFVWAGEGVYVDECVGVRGGVCEGGGLFVGLSR